MSTRSQLTRKQKKRREMLRRRRITFLVLILIVLLPLAVYLPHSRSKPHTADNAKSYADILVSADFEADKLSYPKPKEKPSDLLAAAVKKDGVKTAFLTFDDGPTTSVTPLILDTLRRYDIKATFFTVGTLIEKNPDMARRLYDEGHLLANHSYSHVYKDIYASTDNFITEIDRVHALITNLTGEADYPKILRFPGGSFNAGSYAEIKQELKPLVAERGYRYCDWNALNGDAESGKGFDPEQLVERLKKTASGKEDIVILMHDSATQSATAKALPDIIEYLMSEGYTFKRLDEI